MRRGGERAPPPCRIAPFRNGREKSTANMFARRRTQKTHNLHWNGHDGQDSNRSSKVGQMSQHTQSMQSSMESAFAVRKQLIW